MIGNNQRNEMNETTNRMKRTATFFRTARLHALCVAACRRLLAQAGLAGGAAVGYPMPVMETLPPTKPPTPGSARSYARDWRSRMPAFLFAGLPPTSRGHPQFRAGIHERKSSLGSSQPRASNFESGDVTPFPAGFVWKRSADWKNVTGGESDIGRVVCDARGGSPWALRLVPSGVEATGLGGAKPWYAQPMDHMSFRSGEKAAYRAANIDHGWPWANATNIGVTAWKADYVYGTPAVEWANPAGRPITLGITGTLRVRWGEKGVPKSVDVAIVHAKADGSQTLLRGEACKRPETAVTELPVTLSDIALGPADRILISLFIAEGAAYGSIATLEDDVELRCE